MKALKYRLYPTKVQVVKLEWTLSRCCELYNAALQERKDIWNACKKHLNFYDPDWCTEHAKDYRVTYYDQANALPTLKRDVRPEYTAIGSQVLQDVLRRVDKAFAAFYRRVRCGQTQATLGINLEHSTILFAILVKQAAQEVGTCHRKIRNQRADFLHKEARDLVKCYETIVFEDLKPKNLSRRPKPKQDENGTFLPNGAAAKAGLNKSIADAAWGLFVRLVRAKAESAGHTTVVLVNPKNTSQICSGCKRKGPHKDLDERTHTCQHCGLVLDRDHNAALNILRLGLSHQEPS
ncbi:MAG: transposase [Ktedonobacteraceae bacterium]|nr:transposase [Ktedonobacteraceae bacterium]